MIEVSAPGSFKKTEDFLSKMKQEDFFKLLDHYGAIGADALSSATPVDSGITASSWTYQIVNKKGSHGIIWHNTNIVNGIPVAILIQYGHATGTGGWVEGRDFINPVIRGLFDQIADEVWKQVTNG